MVRHVEEEWLDRLPESDVRAQASRRDLRRLNWWMGNRAILARALTGLGRKHPQRILELGAGDGDLMSRVAEKFGEPWQGMEATLIDRQNVLSESAAERFRRSGWKAAILTCDILDWSGQARLEIGDLVVVNLFLHHLEKRALARLFEAIARPGVDFVALEPRRSRFALMCSRLVGLIGCNAVTQHDAPASVRAGFRGRELSELWPEREGWVLEERGVGLFGHLFVARARPREE